MTGSFGLEEKHSYCLLQGQYYFTAGNLNHLIVCFTQCLFNMLGICTVGNCVSLLQGFWEHKSGIKYPPTRTFFLTCFLHTLYESFTGQIFMSLGLSMFTGIACRLQLWIKTSNLENSILAMPKLWVLVELHLSFLQFVYKLVAPLSLS